MLTDEEKERCRYHLGYIETSGAASLQFGLPKPVQTAFILEQSFGLLNNEFAVDRVRRVLFTLDGIEEKLRDATCVLVAEKLGDITLRGADDGKTYPDLLEREYIRWAKRLADILGVPLYAYSDRFKSKGGTRNLNVQG